MSRLYLGGEGRCAIGADGEVAARRYDQDIGPGFLQPREGWAVKPFADIAAVDEAPTGDPNVEDEGRSAAKPPTELIMRDTSGVNLEPLRGQGERRLLRGRVEDFRLGLRMKGGVVAVDVGGDHIGVGVGDRRRSGDSAKSLWVEGVDEQERRVIHVHADTGVAPEGDLDLWL